MKKVLYIWKGPYPWDVRVEKVCKSFVNNGWEVLMLARWNGEDQQEEIIDGINIYRAGYGKKRHLMEPVSFNPNWKSEIEKAVQRFKPDVIMPREIMLGVAAGKAGRKYDIPVIMDMAENYPAAMREWKKYNSNAFRRFLMHKAKVPDITERNSLKYMDGVIVVCSEQIQRLADDFNYKTDNIVVVHNTPDFDSFKNIRTGCSEPPVVFGHHGNMTAEKSVANFVKGFIIAASENENIRLHLAGEGDVFDDVKQIVASSAHRDKINLSGRYEFSELSGIISGFDIGVIPYQVNDFNNYTIHNKIFDYFAAGKPVFVSKAKPLERIVNETNAGISVDCSDPDIIADNILNYSNLDYKIFSENGIKAFREKYNWQSDEKVLLEFTERYC